jgi:hypothetical protein
MTNITAGQTMIIAKFQFQGIRGWIFEDITVTKVGKKYAYFGSGRRFGIATMMENGPDGSRVYTDRKAFYADQDRQRKWTAIRNKIARIYEAPPQVTTHMIERAIAVLEIEL